MTQTSPFIQVRNLAHTYLRGTPMETPSLHSVNFEVCLGETVGVVGPTGSGKSTLLQHLNGLYRPQQGQVIAAGFALTDPGVDLRIVRQRIGLLFQNPEDQLFERFAGDDVAFGPRNMGWPPARVRESVRLAMETVGLPFALKDRATLELSQGQRRRLALAGVMAMEPQALVLDEPTAGLDPYARRQLLATLRRWSAVADRALVLATHNMEDIAALCSRLYVLAGGRVLLEGTPQAVFANRKSLWDNGLTVPLASEVMARLRERGFLVPTDALSVAQASAEIVRRICD